MSRAREGFEHLAEEAKKQPGHRMPTWAELAQFFQDAAKVVDDWEYSDRMGDDM